jgi:hypothetical protein
MTPNPYASSPNVSLNTRRDNNALSAAVRADSRLTPAYLLALDVQIMWAEDLGAADTLPVELRSGYGVELWWRGDHEVSDIHHSPSPLVSSIGRADLGSDGRCERPVAISGATRVPQVDNVVIL